MLPTRLIAGVTSGIVSSAVFATALTLVNFGETFLEPLRVDPAHPAPITLRMPRLAIEMTDPHTGGKRISTISRTVPRGYTSNDDLLSTWVRKFERDRRPPRPTELAASWFVYFLLCLAITASLRHSVSKRGSLLRTQVGLLLASFVLLLGAKVFLLMTPYPESALPVAVVPLWVSFFIDRRTGFEFALALAVLHASFVSYDPLGVAVFITCGSVAALTIKTSKHSLLLIAAGLAAGSASAVTYVAVKEIVDGFVLSAEMEHIWRSGLAGAAAGGVLSGLFAYLFRWPIGRMLGTMSRGQLLDLTDLEHPLLKKMAQEAPGSWEHSRAMANLAEAAAASIGADASLTRVGGYYHDIGKTCQPEYFVENLDPEERSPHDDLEPNVSADAIMAHVVEGTRILREHKIPEPVVEFAYAHHGTSLIEFFWHKYRKNRGTEELPEDAFRYPGIRPRTKETAIVLLVDSIEAAARTIEPPSRERFEEMVQRTIFGKLRQGQLDESGLTLADLKMLATQITDSLCRVYHARIRYPWQNGDEAEARANSKPSRKEVKRESDGDDATTGKYRALQSEPPPRKPAKGSNRSDKKRDEATADSAE
jgi:putative nucleotidyltransferase with HDIG domain